MFELAQTTNQIVGMELVSAFLSLDEVEKSGVGATRNLCQPSNDVLRTFPDDILSDAKDSLRAAPIATCVIPSRVLSVDWYAVLLVDVLGMVDSRKHGIVESVHHLFIERIRVTTGFDETWEHKVDRLEG